jgi:cyclophilin family peptidyl-prolyl cis-trans isomerase
MNIKIGIIFLTVLIIIYLICNKIDIKHNINHNYPKAIIKTQYGNIKIGFFTDIAPITTKHITNLIKGGHYDNTRFGRIVPGFVIQTDICKDRIKCQKKIKGEFSNIKHTRGVLSMGREDHDYNSNTSSFSILCGPAPHLNNKYTIFGKVIKGNKVIKKIENDNKPMIIKKIILIK